MKNSSTSLFEEPSAALHCNRSTAPLQVSVVIATRNRAGQIAQTLDSLCEQSVPAEVFEVIAVDNGSSDATRDVVLKYLTRRPHWKLLREPKPGAAAARNTGIRDCQAPILLFLDDDVVADRELIEQHLKSHRERSGVATLGAVRFPWRGNESPFFWTLNRHPELFQSFHFADPQDVPFQYFYTCNLSMPKEFFVREAGFDEGFTTSGFEDTELGYRFVNAGFRIIFNQRASVLHDARMTFQQFSQKRYSGGQWARYLVRKYPQLQAVLFGSTPLKSRISYAIGFSATPLGPLFDLRSRGMNQLLLSVLGFLCWHHLQYRFRAGFGSTPRPRVLARIATSP